MQYGDADFDGVSCNRFEICCFVVGSCSELSSMVLYYFFCRCGSTKHKLPNSLASLFVYVEAYYVVNIYVFNTYLEFTERKFFIKILPMVSKYLVYFEKYLESMIYLYNRF